MRELALLHLGRDEAGRALGRVQQALDAVEPMLGGLGEEQGARARESQSSLFAVGAWAAVLEENPAEAFRCLESGRAGALLDALGKREMLRWREKSLPASLIEADRKAQVARAEARAVYDRAARRSDLAAMRDAGKDLDEAIARVHDIAGRIQRELKAQADLFYARAETLDVLQGALEEDQALVIYGLTLEAVALVVRRGSARIVRLGSVADVEALPGSLHWSDATSNPGAAVAVARNRLVEPLKLGKDIKQVLVSPEGSLCYVPFALLFDRPVALTPSGSTHVVLRDDARSAGAGVLALGDPDYAGVSEAAKAIYFRGRALSPLPASRTEVEAVASEPLLGSDASEARLRAALAGRKRWRAVHFACHGLVDTERPMHSSLALSRDDEDDGFLTGLEVLRMDIPADLAVLSACETGRGKIVRAEGIRGKASAGLRVPSCSPGRHA